MGASEVRKDSRRRAGTKLQLRGGNCVYHHYVPLRDGRGDGCCSAISRRGLL